MGLGGIVTLPGNREGHLAGFSLRHHLTIPILSKLTTHVVQSVYNRNRTGDEGNDALAVG